MRSSSSLPAQRTSRWAPFSSAIRTRRPASASSSTPRSPRLDCATSKRRAALHMKEDGSRRFAQKPRKWVIDLGCGCVRLARSMVSSTKAQAQAPARSRDQRMEALKRANDIRVRRAKLKKDLKEGHVKIETILRSPPEYVSTAKVFDILMAVPKFGRVKAARFLNQCRISQS